MNTNPYQDLDPDEPLPAQPSRSLASMLVIPAGLATTALALLISWLLSETEFNVMGWYVWAIFPIGALMVGFLAGSGYSIVSQLGGVRITTTLLVIIFVLQLVAYIEALHLDYQAFLAKNPTIQGLDFFNYIDVTTRSFSFKPKNGVGTGTPLGSWGYAIRLLEVLGFAGGGIAWPLIVRGKPYCDHCAKYMRKRGIVDIPAYPTAKLIKQTKKEKIIPLSEIVAAHAQQADAAIVEANGYLAEENALALIAFTDRYAAQAAETKKLEQLVTLNLIYCAGCNNGHVNWTLTKRSGNQTNFEVLSQHPASAALIAECRRLRPKW